MRRRGGVVAGLTWCQAPAARVGEEAPEGPDVPLDESTVVVEPEDVQEVRPTSDLEIGGGVPETGQSDQLKSSPALRPWRSKVDQASLLSLAMGLRPF